MNFRPSGILCFVIVLVLSKGTTNAAETRSKTPGAEANAFAQASAQSGGSFAPGSLPPTSLQASPQDVCKALIAAASLEDDTIAKTIAYAVAVGGQPLTLLAEGIAIAMQPGPSDPRTITVARALAKSNCRELKVVMAEARSYAVINGFAQSYSEAVAQSSILVSCLTEVSLLKPDEDDSEGAHKKHPLGGFYNMLLKHYHKHFSSSMDPSKRHKKHIPTLSSIWSKHHKMEETVQEDTAPRRSTAAPPPPINISSDEDEADESDGEATSSGLSPPPALIGGSPQAVAVGLGKANGENSKLSLASSSLTMDDGHSSYSSDSGTASNQGNGLSALRLQSASGLNDVDNATTTSLGSGIASGTGRSDLSMTSTSAAEKDGNEHVSMDSNSGAGSAGTNDSATPSQVEIWRGTSAAVGRKLLGNPKKHKSVIWG